MSNIRGYNTRQYEIVGYSDSTASLTTGMAVKITRLPIISSPATATDFYFYFAVAPSDSEVDGVVSVENGNANPVSNTTIGRIVTLNSGFIPVLVDSDLKKGDAIKVGMNGKWTKAKMGDKSFGILAEDISKDTIGLAKPYIHKVA